MKNENGKLKIFSLLALLFLAIGLVSCADEDGLHDQSALQVTFEVTGLGDDVNGTYCVTGVFDDWSRDYPITLTKGEGKSEQIPISISSFKFTVCDKTDSNWTRAWYPTYEGNQADENTSGNPYHNFYIENLDLDAGEITIVISPENLDGNGRIEPKVK